MNKSSVTLIAITLFLAACSAAPQQEGAKVAPTAKDAQRQEVTEGSIAGDFMVYEDGVVGNGESAVLFFYDPSCPKCTQNQENLIEWYTLSEFPMKTYRVDFASETALRQQYGVTQHDTFILVDGAGKAIATEVAPSSTKLKRLLYANIEAAKTASSVDHGGWVDQAGDPGVYTDYIDGAIGNGMESVLFFHAAWCPYCIANSTRLENWYASNDFQRSTYKIDFDTALNLRKEFGVTQQDTFILIDGNGNEVSRLSFPSETALRDLLQ